MPAPQTQPSMTEFILLIASMVSLVAMSIDAMLPALPAIADDLGVTVTNQRQWVVSFLLLGMGFGQLILPLMSDVVGRRPAILLGFTIFIAGCVISLLAQSFTAMLIGRVLQGLGAAGPRAVTIALVRDRYRGTEMARVMSFMMSVFIIVPALAPSIGQFLLFQSGWRSIFLAFLLLSVSSALWFYFRQPETLPATARSPLSGRQLTAHALEVVRQPLSLGYMIIMGLVFGAFLSYLNTAQQIFQDIYPTGEQFPLYFALLALGIGAASLFNARLLKRWPIHHLTRITLVIIALLSLLFLLWISRYHGKPPLAHAVVYMLLSISPFGILFGNINAIAMEPLGHIAGTGTAIIGAVSTLISVPIGLIIGMALGQTLYPVVLGFILLPLLSLGIMARIDHSALNTAAKA